MDESEILAVAMDLAEAEGGRALTMERLAETAGISRATLYRRFSSKRALTTALIEAGFHAGPSPASTRARILEAARQSIGVRGDLTVTIEDIAAAAEVSAMSVYRIFGDREALFRTVIQEISPRRGARRAIDSRRPVAEVLRAVARATIGFALENPGMMLVGMLDTPASRAMRALQDEGPSTRAMLVAYFETAIERGELLDSPPRRLLAYWVANTIAEPVLARQLGVSTPEPEPELGTSGREAEIDAIAVRVVDNFLAAFGARR